MGRRRRKIYRRRKEPNKRELEILLDSYENNVDFHYLYIAMTRYEKLTIDHLIANGGGFKNRIFHR